MSSRAEILAKVKQNKPTLVPLPNIDFNDLITYPDLITQFISVVEKIGGAVFLYPTEEDLAKNISLEPNETYNINTLNMSEAEKLSLSKVHSLDLERVHTAYFRGKLGVAENGSIWLDEEAMVNRVLPIICEHLVLVLDKNLIVPTMHHAYQNIDVSKTGYGTFLAGPSKTADIEQSLVIGAHGPRSLKVCLIG
ncbi:hypothetical protein EZJ43_00660 [Pedobacter changchengzhani]|uniref:LUD domain-containing protein n=1 Tax=Pedobacter changchengzhani TaxID=2529274 RepID=A0A4R5MP58_9SPHI|nr:LUD domain-containing protein [Pedobacter changchengzhani]TDG37640.1 hypothetical protein EZJ43_00660 [Pedobacter changchengzhani]